MYGYKYVLFPLLLHLIMSNVETNFVTAAKQMRTYSFIIPKVIDAYRQRDVSLIYHESRKRLVLEKLNVTFFR